MVAQSQIKMDMIHSRHQSQFINKVLCREGSRTEINHLQPWEVVNKTTRTTENIIMAQVMLINSIALIKIKIHLIFKRSTVKIKLIALYASGEEHKGIKRRWKSNSRPFKIHPMDIITSIIMEVSILIHRSTEELVALDHRVWITFPELLIQEQTCITWVVETNSNILELGIKACLLSFKEIKTWIRWTTMAWDIQIIIKIYLHRFNFQELAITWIIKGVGWTQRLIFITNLRCLVWIITIKDIQAIICLTKMEVQYRSKITKILT